MLRILLLENTYFCLCVQILGTPCRYNQKAMKFLGHNANKSLGNLTLTEHIESKSEVGSLTNLCKWMAKEGGETGGSKKTNTNKSYEG